jgi:predicted Zn-dependent peptidase
MYASPKEGQTLEEAKNLLMEQVNILKKGTFDESLIKAIAANYKLSRLQGLESNTTRVSNIADQFILNRGTKWNTDLAIIDEMSKVTKKEVVDFANKFFGNNNYVVLYKRKGEDKNIVKVEKPPITPVETNAGKSSPFVKSITETPLPSLKPVFVDYTKDLQKGKLSNADMLYVQNKENALFRLAYRFEMGSWNNKVLPFAAAYLQYLGTDKYSSEQISKQFYNLACSWDVSVANEQTVITLSGLNENFDKAVDLFEHLLRNCKADETALQGMINLQMKARANSKLNKAAIALALQSYAMYGAKNPVNSTLTNDEVKALKAQDLTELLHSLTNYEHRVTYFGPQPLPALTAQLQKLHKVPASWTSNTNAAKFKRIDQTSNKVLFTNYDAVQSEIYWVKNLEAYDPKNEALVNLFNNYFGNGMGSIVFQTIRESKALAYSTNARVVTPTKKDDNFSIVAYVGSQADKMNDAVAGMNELLNNLPRTDQNLENARQTLLKNTETGRIVDNAIIDSYLNSQRKGLDYDLRKDNYVKYSSLKMDDIYNFHQQKLAKQPYTYCIIASDKKINLEDLKKYGELQVVGLEELFGY